MTIRTEIDRAIRTGKDIEIEYVKYDGTRSRRRVSNISYCNDYEDYGYENDHISGFCHLRGEDRHFKIDRIQSIRVLPDGPLVKNPKDLVSESSYNSYSGFSVSHVGGSSTSHSSSPSKATSSYSTSPKEGCYIATMAYGDYNHPKVIILRKYRDDVLAKSVFGKVFIRFYYATSPTLVKVLRNKEDINNSIRQVLDYLIKCIQSKHL